MFVGSERAGRAAAIYYSLVESCKANKVNPLTYLTYAVNAQTRIIGRLPMKVLSFPTRGIRELSINRGNLQMKNMSSIAAAAIITAALATPAAAAEPTLGNIPAVGTYTGTSFDGSRLSFTV